MIDLGDTVKDKITGYSGVVAGVTTWLYSCRRIGIQPKKLNKDGKPHDILWFDEPQCILIKKAVKAISKETIKKQVTKLGKTGGPTVSPTRNVDPVR